MTTNLVTKETQSVRFVYVENKATNRRVTVAYMYDDSNNAISAAVAECSNKDQFVKKIGRDIAFGRLVKSGGVSIPFSVMGGSSYSDVAAYWRNRYAGEL